MDDYKEATLPDRVARFDRITSDMIAINGESYQHRRNKTLSYCDRYRPAYEDKDRVTRIIETGTLEEQRSLSRTFFEKKGFYKRIIMQYATLLKYVGLLIPCPGYNQKLDSEANKKKYFKALNFVEKMNLRSFLTRCTMKVLIDGCYYGIILKDDKKNSFSVLDLPWEYCRTDFKDKYDNDIIEFDLRYFDKIVDENDRRACLKVYPKEIAREYRKWEKRIRTDPWVSISTDISICFPFLESGQPFFLSIIPAILDYDDTVDVEKAGQLEEIKKVLVQKVPHLTTGELLFEPEEAEVMHRGSVRMMSGNKFLSILTTYCDVDAIVSRTTENATNNYIDKMVTNIYNEAGVSRELFATTSNLALKYSVKNDINLMMVLGNKYSTFITNLINRLFGNASLSFKYVLLPVSSYIEDEYITNSFKLAQSGYSILLPAIGMGFSQSELMNLKDLENDVLDINEKFKPLQSAYTQSSSSNGTPGAPEKEADEKSPKTARNLEGM